MLFRAFLLSLLLVSTVAAETLEPTHNAVASAHPLATRAGISILEAGGNAFDSAVAVTAALAVVEPYSSGLGGGGFYLLHRSDDGFQVMLDAREKAPLAATREMYLDANGKPTKDSLEGPRAAGIPGIPAALVHLSEKYGRLPLKTVLAPAIALARDGFKVDAHYVRMAGFRKELLVRNAEASKIFLHHGAVPDVGHRAVQPELAQTLEQIAEQGMRGFYDGKTAEKMVEGVRAAGGIWNLNDLSGYEVVERQPIRGVYRGWHITSAAPPSSGGIALMTMLRILDGFDLEKMSQADRVHHIVETMRHAYRDRAEFLGDSDFVDVPAKRLTSEENAASKRDWIKVDEATPSASLPPVPVNMSKGEDTTHFSILDKEGNRVAATLSINYPFGSGFVVPGTGVLLNDEMDDFSARPGVPNAYGLVGAEANAIEPGKRPLSSMSPTFIENGERLAILGTPGGSRIITMVLLGVLEFMEGGGADEIVRRPRFHHQYLPDSITYENGAFPEDVINELGLMGHIFAKRKGAYGEENPVYGNMQVVVWDKVVNSVQAASDPRVTGHAMVD